MNDTIALTNLTYVMPAKTSGDITKISKEYRDERFRAAMESYQNCQMMAKFMKGIVGTVMLSTL